MIYKLSKPIDAAFKTKVSQSPCNMIKRNVSVEAAFHSKCL